MATAKEIKYVSDPRGTGDHIQPVDETLTLKAGDCEDQTILLNSLLEAVGVRTLMAFTDDHVLTLACMEKKPARRWLARGAAHYTIEHEGSTRTCYPLEPTASNARVGQLASDDPLVALLDPITRESLQVKARDAGK